MTTLNRDLVTDGSVLCWVDSLAMVSMPIGGGPVTTLAGGAIGQVSVLGGTLYFVELDENAIFSVPTRGEHLASSARYSSDAKFLVRV